MNTVYGPHTLREAFDLTLEFKKEYQITQPGPDFKVMETCYEDLEDNDELFHRRSTDKISRHKITLKETDLKVKDNNQYHQGNKQPVSKTAVSKTAVSVAVQQSKFKPRKSVQK